VDDAFRRLTGRTPQPREQEILTRLLTEQLDYFKTQPEAAAKYLAIGERPRDAALSAEQVAATTVMTSAVMNHDEFVMKR
jgi:hypothetical protein